MKTLEELGYIQNDEYIEKWENTRVFIRETENDTYIIRVYKKRETEIMEHYSTAFYSEAFKYGMKTRKSVPLNAELQHAIQLEKKKLGWI